MRGVLSFFWEIFKIVVIALAIVLPVRYFLFQPFIVKGQSMEPNFQNNNYLIVDELSYRFRDPVRGEVVIFYYPRNPKTRFIKRIIGLPGETLEIKGGKVKINGKVLDESEYLPPGTQTIGDIRISLKKDEYFVLGDNRLFSYDSRRWGVLPRKYIIGRAILRAWPFTIFREIDAPAFST